MNYSYTRISTFRQCPRKYSFQYIEKPSIEKRPTVENHLGKTCHSTVQQIYKDLALSRVMTLDEMLAFYEDLWERSRPKNLRIVNERYSEENYRETGRKYVTTFYETNAPFKDGHTIGIEKPVEIKLGDTFMLIGYIDRLVDHGNGHYEIIDYKTNKELPTLEDLEQNWQLPLYHMGLIQMLPDLKEATCTWYFLAHNKPLSLRWDHVDLGELEKEIMEKITVIEQTKEFPTKVTPLCSWCDYEIICPARKHLVACENLPAKEFSKEEGVKLVDDYLETVRVLEESKAKKVVLEKQIFQYGKQHGVIFVRGSQDKKIRIWTKDGATRLIGKDENPEAGQAIVAILKKHGLWDKYSMLSTLSFLKAVDGKVLPAAVIAELTPYLKHEDIFKLYPSNIRDWE